MHGERLGSVRQRERLRVVASDGQGWSPRGVQGQQGGQQATDQKGYRGRGVDGSGCGTCNDPDRRSNGCDSAQGQVRPAAPHDRKRPRRFLPGSKV